MRNNRAAGRMFLATLLCVSSAAVFAPPVAGQTRLAFRNLSIADGLSQNSVLAIAQDKRGFMWFGTKDGLNRYDGHQFVVFRHNPRDSTSISDSEISALFVDSRGRLWVGTRTGGANVFDSARERFVHVAAGPTHVVTAFAEDKSGAIWIGATGEGLYRVTDSATNGPMSVERFVHSPNDPASLSDDRVRALLVDRSGILWAATSSGLDRRDTDAGQRVAFTHYTAGTPGAMVLADSIVSSLLEDSRGRLWIGGISGISEVDSARTHVKRHYHKYRTYRKGWGQAVDLAEDRAGRIWIATPSELMRFDAAADTFDYYPPNAQDAESIHGDLPTRVFRDRSDVMWVSTNGYGINVHDPKANRFETFRGPAKPSRLSGFSVYTLFEDRAGSLWINAGLLYNWNRTTGAIRRFETTSDRPNDFGNTAVWSIVEDPTGFLWAATNQGLYHYEIASGKSRQYHRNPVDTTGLREETVFGVFRDRDGAIWTVTENYLARLTDTTRGKFQSWQYKERLTSAVWVFPSVLQDSAGRLWLGSDQGLVRFSPSTLEFRHYRHDAKNAASLSNDVIRSILADPREPNKFLWIGTAGGGLNRFDIASETFTAFTEHDGLPNNVVYGVLGEPNGMLWLSMNKGLARFDPATKTFRNYDANDGLQSNEFNSGAAFRSKSGELFFGGIYGFNYFRPEAIVDNPHRPPVAITAFRRGNRYETIRDSGTALSKSITESDTLHLSYHDAVIAFEFAALEYSAPAKNLYRYRMRGFNEQWVEAGTVRVATYTNLPPGHYTFEVRASNNDGLWNESGASLIVTVQPPWYRTWWAYAFYTALLVGLLIAARNIAVHRVRLESRLKFERLEAEQLRELNRARSNLFANVSHEFRTPLTLTLGPLDDLRSGRHGQLSTSAVEQVDLARRNASRVLDLINEILELARAEAGRLTVNAQRIELGTFVAGVARPFASLAERRSVVFDVHEPPEPIFVFVDPQHLDRALSNLLSNAFKFVPDHGAVRVTVFNDVQSARIAVRDSGPGVPAADLDRIFDRFHRAVSSTQHSGTGIGLSLASELVVLNGGSITVDSQVGFGSTFTIALRHGNAHFSSAQLATAPVVPPFERGVSAAHSGAVGRAVISGRAEGKFAEFSAHGGNGNAADPSVSDLELSEDITTVLIVDDNDEVRAFVKQHLVTCYRVLEAANGQEGLAMARRQLPDLVLSDVMMPVMDGYALCRALKSEPETDFIPVILLTARAETEDLLAGLTERADDYLTKPFDVRELMARIGNVIETRRRLRERYTRTPDYTAGAVAAAPDELVARRDYLEIHPAAVNVAPADRKLIEAVRLAIETNIGDESYTVERLATDVAQSRGHLHRRLRELLDESPSDLIRRMRLERAAALLEAGAGTVAEIAYAVGFKSVAHFSNAFTAQHGVRPSAWRAAGKAR